MLEQYQKLFLDDPSGFASFGDGLQDDREGQEPMEYFMLDYLDCVPEGLARKLRQSLEAYESHIHRLSQQNERLWAKVKACDERRALVAVNTLGSCSSLASSSQKTAAIIEGRHRPYVSRCSSAPNLQVETETLQSEIKRSHTALRIAAAQETRLRVEAEAHEKEMGARLDRIRQAAQERVAEMTHRAQREEEGCSSRAYAAKADRMRVERASERVREQQGDARIQLSDLEEKIREADRRYRVGEKVRRTRAKELEALRSELKAHRPRATRHHIAQQRVRDVQRELRATLTALAECPEVEANEI
jgi:chromosome segregation ATPase